MLPLCLAVVLFPTTATPQGQNATPTVRLYVGPGADVTHAAFEVVGLAPDDLQRLQNTDWDAPQWNALFSVAVDVAPVLDTTPLTPILGAHAVRDQVLRFTPRFPLEPGLRYRAVFDPARLPRPARSPGGTVTAVFRLPERKLTPTARVDRVDPTADLLPENLLKFYVHFSAPMSRGNVYQYIHLLDQDGQPIDLPFLELGEELWGPSGRRLTLLLDPGRIKRGLKPREEEGPILEEGKRYTFVIDAAWEDAQGAPLKAPFRKAFRVGPPDDTSPNPKSWAISSPPAGSTTPVIVAFPEPLDRAMLDRAFAVTGPEGDVLAGSTQVPDDARSWRFTPDRPWRPGQHRLIVDTTLEDLAGNSVARPFEVDVLQPIEREVTTDTVAVPFEVRPVP